MGVMFRGRVRKFALQDGINLLIENASDKENCVRFAVMQGRDPDPVRQFIASHVTDASIEKVVEVVVNPVLSKLKVNKEERYEI